MGNAESGGAASSEGGPSLPDDKSEQLIPFDAAKQALSAAPAQAVCLWLTPLQQSALTSCFVTATSLRSREAWSDDSALVDRVLGKLEFGDDVVQVSQHDRRCVGHPRLECDPQFVWEYSRRHPGDVDADEDSWDAVSFEPAGKHLATAARSGSGGWGALMHACVLWGVGRRNKGTDGKGDDDDGAKKSLAKWKARQPSA